MARLPNFLVIIRSEKLSGKGQGRGCLGVRKKERFVLGKRTFRSQKSKHFVLRIIQKTIGYSREDLIRYIPFMLNSEHFWIYANKHADGMNSKRISKDTLLEYEFELPSIDEMRDISDKLWAAYRLKEAYKKLLVTTDEMVKSQFIEMFGNPVTNTKGWKTAKIKDVAPEMPSKEQLSGKIWLLNLDMIESNTGRIIEKVYEDVENALSVQSFDEGNVLFSKLRPYLNKVVIPDEPGMATTELVPLRPEPSKLHKVFLSHMLRGNQFVNYANDIAGGTKMPRMPLTELRNFDCILPPMDKQLEFVFIAEQADKSKFELKQCIEHIDKVIKSLING